MLFFALWLLISGPSSAHASVYDKVNLKMYEKIRTRWALENLFVRNRRSKPREQWLPYNPKKAPMFELMADVRMGTLKYGNNDLHPQKKQPLKVASGGLQAFLGPVGISIQREQYKFSQKWWNRDEGTFYLRILGSSTQSTHVTLFTGTQKSDTALFLKYEQQFQGILTNLYLTRYLGLEGMYRYRPKTDSDTHSIRGTDQHWGFFFESSILRLSVLFRQESNRATSLNPGTGGVAGSSGFQGYNGGLLQARLNF
ncbi:MAG: hypothetical protein ACLGG7_11710 [Bacteriovoracia bacterium]